MQISRTIFIASILIIVGGCIGVTAFRFHRKTKDVNITNDYSKNKEESSSIDISTKFKGQLGENSIPRIVDLPDARVEKATKDELENCTARLNIKKEIEARADETNFGERINIDAWNRPLQAKPMIIILHETVMSKNATVSYFQTPHANDADQASYHMLIAIDGSRLRVVPDEKRAYGAGMSAFGDATQRTKPSSVGSINNIALHISLVTPVDGRDNNSGHSGYTFEQYRSLAQQTLLWQAKFGIPLTRVTTHAAVDRSHSRYDPRSFNWDIFDRYYRETASLCGFNRFDNGKAGL